MSYNRDFKILYIDASGVKTNKAPQTPHEKRLLYKAMMQAKNMMLDKLMKEHLKEQAEEYERNKAVYPQGYRVNSAPWK